MGIERIRCSSDSDISVVVPTIPDSDHTDTITRLLNQTFNGDYEIIVVNDNCLDVCEARNTGLHESNAPIIAFTDDDCKPPANWLSIIDREYKENSSLVCLEGAVQGGINYSGRRKYLTCNLAVDRECAINVGGFRSVYAGWREDTEFGWRMERDGDGDCMYCNDMTMKHPSRPRAMFDERNEGLLKREYPERYQALLNGSIGMKAFRWLQRSGGLEAINKMRYSSK